jgi:hypothetical protein
MPMSENGRWQAHLIISDDDGDAFILILCVPLASINSMLVLIFATNIGNINKKDDSNLY